MQIRYGKVTDRLMRVLNAMAVGARPSEIKGAKNDDIKIEEKNDALSVGIKPEEGALIYMLIKDYKDFLNKCKQARKVLIYILAHIDAQGVSCFDAYEMVKDGLAARESSAIRMIRQSMELLQQIQIMTDDSPQQDYRLIRSCTDNRGKIQVNLTSTIISKNKITLPDNAWRMSQRAFSALLYLLYIRDRTAGWSPGTDREIAAHKLCSYLYLDPEKCKQRAEVKRVCERIIREIQEAGVQVEMDKISSFEKWKMHGKIRIKKKGAINGRQKIFYRSGGSIGERVKQREKGAADEDRDKRI